MILCCITCNKEFNRRTTQQFCSRSCAAKYNNKIRKESGWAPSEDHRKKVSTALKNKNIKRNNKSSKSKTIAEDNEYYDYASLLCSCDNYDLSNRWNKRSVVEACVNSNTYTDILKKIGIKPIGGNINTLHNYLKLYNIPFISKPHKNRDYSQGIRIATNDQLFVEHCQIARSVVRKRIIKFNIIPYKCAKCGLLDKWQNSQITLQLEHKNGINNDNRLENLEFLCPNCHSQTFSWAGRGSNKQHRISKKYVN